MTKIENMPLHCHRTGYGINFPLQSRIVRQQSHGIKIALDSNTISQSLNNRRHGGFSLNTNCICACYVCNNLMIASNTPGEYNYRY